MAALLIVLADPAGAQEAQPAAPPREAGGRIAYQAAYFAQFAPRTALDMISRTPGFTLQEGLERRGFAAALGNVLVDGKRPIAKSQTLTDILQRIPASQVQRIELLSGGRGVSEGGSAALVANVVRTPSAGGGVWSLGSEYAGRTPVPNGWASWSGRFGDTDYSLGTNAYSLMRDLPGERRITGPDPRLLETRRDKSPRSFYELAVNGEAERPMLGGSVRVTGQASLSRYREDASIFSFDAAGAETGAERNPYVERNRALEAGIDHERDLGGWDFGLAALVTRKRFDSDVSSTRESSQGQILSVFAQELLRHSGETIIRATLARQVASGHRVDAAIEGSLNSLDQQLSASLDLGQGAFPIFLPNANLGVREKRAEGSLTHGWTIDRRLSVETRFAAEISHLSFAGDTDDSVRLLFFKPSIQITRRLGRRNEVRLRFYRDVGQLDFTDFVSSASVTDDIIVGGNPELRPEKSWRFEAISDLRFGEAGALSLKLFRYWIDNVVDFVPAGPLGNRFDAPGNISKGTVLGGEATLRLPLARIVKGGSLTLEGSLKRSRVADPLTGARRRISDFGQSAFKAEFRQDLPERKLAWGATYTAKPERILYRFNEIERRRDSPSLDLWAERKILGAYTAKISLLSLLGSPEKRDRAFFAPDRSGKLIRVEKWRRHPGRWLLLSVSGSF